MQPLMKFRAKQSRRRSRSFSPWCSALERLESRSLLSATIAAPGTQTTLEDTAKVVSGLSFTSSADPVTVTLSTTNGTLTLSANISSGLTAGNISGNGTSSVTITANVANVNTTLANAAGLTYTPATNSNGSDTLTANINNGGDSVTTTIPLSVTAVNDVPNFTLSPTNPPVVNEDSALQMLPFATTTNFGAANESSQAITKFTVTSIATTGGLTFATAPSIDPITGNLSYQPAANSNGTATFSVTATDNGGTANSGSDTSAAQTFIITVNAVNDAPTIAVPGSQTTAEDTAKVISGLSFADVDAGSANVVVTLVVSHGTLTLSANVASGLTATQITSNGAGSVTITAPLAAINATLNTSGLTYTPNTDFNGNSDALAITIDDQGNTGSGGTQTGTTSVPITVTAVNDAPSFVLATNPPAVIEDPGLQTIIGFVSSITVGPVNESVSQTISNFTVTQVSSTGGLTFLTAPNIDPTGTLMYQAALNASGTATFTVTLTDSGSNASPNVNTSATKTFVITVTSVNDAPTIATPAMQTTLQGIAKVITGISFADVDAGTSNVTVTLSVAGGILTLPGNLTNGVTTSQITGNGTANVTVTAPLAAINTTFAGVAATTTTTSATGLTYTPNALFFGFDSMSITINDNGNTGGPAQTKVESLSIFVTPANGTVTITDETPNVTYTAKGSAKLRAVVVNGLLSVTINGIAYPFYKQTSKIETLTFNGGSGKDEVNLTGLSAVLYPKLTKIVIKGGAGNDSLIGTNIKLLVPVTQTINGDAGNDTLTGGFGDDMLNGGTGTDLLIQAGDVDFMLTNTSLDGLGADLLTGVENVSLTGGINDNTLDAIAFTLGSVTLIGGDGSDTLIGGSKNDAISGQDGDDELIGNGGNDTISGGLGNDDLEGNAGNDLLIGGFGDDIIDGGTGDDTAVGGQGGQARNGNSQKDADDMILAGTEHIKNELFAKLFVWE